MPGIAEDIKVGDKVCRKDGSMLRSGFSSYAYAVVLSLNPFRLASERRDMTWQSTVKVEDFEKLTWI